MKSVDPTLKVGGDATWNPSGDGGYRESFLDYCAAHNVPLDFYSWHYYADQSADPYENVRLAGTIRGILDAHGFPKAESILSEWNLSSDCFSEKGRAELESMHNAASIGAALSYFQDAPLDYAMYYRGDAAPWVGLFDRQGRYFKTAYTFKAMGKMLDTPMRLAVEGTDTLGFAALAGRSADGKTVQLFISNYAISPEFMHKHLSDRTNVVYRDNSGYNLAVNNLPWGKGVFSSQALQAKRDPESATGGGEIRKRRQPEIVQFFPHRYHRSHRSGAQVIWIKSSTEANQDQWGSTIRRGYFDRETPIGS